MIVLPYILTFFAFIIDSVHNFPELAIFLTAIGVIWTFIYVRRVLEYRLKGILISESVHIVIWVVFKYYPEFGGSILGLFFGIIVAIFIAIYAWVNILQPLFSGNSEEDKPILQKEKAMASMPTIIYDSDNNRWQCSWSENGEAVYYNDDGREVHIYHWDIYGNSANTSAGHFHWY